MIRVERPESLDAVVNLPASKSITNRLLIMQALSDGRITIGNVSNASDSVILSRLLKDLPGQVDAGDSGTACRFMTSFLSNRPGRYTIQGTGRMHQRPMGELVEGLRLSGAQIEYLERSGFLPLRIFGKKLEGGVVNLDASLSSQFVTALLLIAPYTKKGLQLRIRGARSSMPYVDMTIGLMRQAGIKLEYDNDTIRIEPQEYRSVHFEVENDWSAASFWYEMVALSESGSVLLKSLRFDSLQGDSVIRSLMESFGVVSEEHADGVLIQKREGFSLPGEFRYDFRSCPDLVMPVAALCAAASVKAELTGVRNLRHKESDRIAALQSELIKTGARVEASDDRLVIVPRKMEVTPTVFQAHDDHRMVMSMAGLAMCFSVVSIDDHLPVSKSYPEFWKELKTAGFNCQVSADPFSHPRTS